MLVAPGTYYENIIWPEVNGIRLFSEMGPESTILDGSAEDRVISFSGIDTPLDSTTLLRGFTVRNGFASDHGGGIRCDKDASVTITENIITMNESGFSGGGISCWGCSPHISDNTISENVAHDRGAGISC